MHSLIREIQKDQLKKVPQIKPGYTVEVHQKIKEGDKERVQIFTGLVIKVSHGEGVEKTFTVRKVVEGIGVEKIFPFHSENIAKIVVKKIAKVRRSKLYYMRERFGKSARLQERQVTDQERATEQARIDKEMEALQAELNAGKVVETEAPAAEANVEVAAEATEAPVVNEAPAADESEAKEA